MLQAVNPVIPGIAGIAPDLIEVRRRIHAHPELAFEETLTSDLVAELLTGWGYEVHRGIGKTGVVGVLREGQGTRTVGLRADMDALPVQEANTFAHRSTVPGAMHACGHDGHTTMLLGAARHLARHGEFDGTVQLFFQPAEESGGGARAMIEDGLFERFPVDAVFGLHNWPGIAAGDFAVRPGPLMASTSLFRINLRGAGCHAAMPHLGRDPVFAAGQVLSALQGIVTRNRNPIDGAVLSVTQVHAGEAMNVVPTDAWLGGTVRTFSDAALDLIETRMRAVVAATATAFDCESEVDFQRQYPATVNDAEQTAVAVAVMRELVGDAHVNAAVDPTMAAEDFSFMLREKPGCYAFLGNGAGDHRVHGHGGGPCLLHNASYDFNDALLPVGASYFVRLVERFLGR